MFKILLNFREEKKKSSLVIALCLCSSARVSFVYALLSTELERVVAGM